MPALNTPPVRYELMRLSGGLDQVTPTLSLSPGVARRAANFECSITGGYTRIAGYERFDGRPNPSDALYTLLTCTITTTIAVGDIVNGATSGASGVVFAIDGNDVAVTKTVGEFVETENLTVSGTTVGTVDSLVGVVADGSTDANYRNLAADVYREDIQAVPGSGPVLGVAYYGGVVYAWRDNESATVAKLYSASNSGWQEVSLGYEFGMTAGTVEPTEGHTVLGATSGATGVISRVVVESGTWGGSPQAAGRLILRTLTGNFLAGETLTVDGTSVATASGDATAITFPAGGRYSTVIANFGGGTNSYRLYGANGVGRAFEFDGTTLVPLNTGMTVDTPKHIAFHKQHLFLTFGASLQFSAIGDPYQWTPLLGAGELAMNGQITNLVVLPGDQSSGALGVYTRNETSVLYGTSSANFTLSVFNTGTGAIAYTAQNMDQAYVLDDRGIMSLGTSLNFGNFLPASLTMNLRPYIQIRRNLATGSVVNREKGQYRVFFSDSTALYMTILNGKVLGTMPVEFAHPVTCCVEGETPDGSTTSFFGSTNGFVYRLDAGTSFDGDPIPANVSLVFNSINAPRVLKRFRRASVEMTGDAYAEIQFGYDLGYRTDDIEQASDSTYRNDLRSGYWDSFYWDNFVYDGKDISPSEIEVNGTGENIAVRISSVSDLFRPFTVNSVILHYTPRRGIR